MKLATVCCLLLLLACTVRAKKGGKKSAVDPEIVNPDPNPPKLTPEMIEGDITSGGNGEDRNAVSNKKLLWPDAKVPYEFDSTVLDKAKPCSDMDAMWGNCEKGGPSLRDVVKTAIKDFDTYTCVRFVPRKGEKDYITVTSKDSGCFSALGRSGGRQWLNLNDPACKSKGVIMHEMLHAIGFDHEQNRSDRDKYVTIKFGNVINGNAGQFKKMVAAAEDNQGSDYDYSSIMHYGEFAFSKKRGRIRTIETTDRSKQKLIGQRSGFSKTDIVEINKLYNCKM